eukprot:SAG31_NODE_975_length_10623_cov_7.244964_7_plen_218_part_00
MIRSHAESERWTRAYASVGVRLRSLQTDRSCVLWLLWSGRWLDDCCRPLKLAWDSTFVAKHQFLASAVVEMEAIAPEAVTTMLEQCRLLQLGLSADGTQAINLRSGKVYWDAATRGGTITYVYKNIQESFDSAAAIVVSTSDSFIAASQPYGRILPAAILDCIAANPTAPLAQRFRLFARHALVHGMRCVSELLEAHAAVVEPPPIDWCGLRFHVGL